jgi:hypothetical protein
MLYTIRFAELRYSLYPKMVHWELLSPLLLNGGSREGVARLE